MVSRIAVLRLLLLASACSQEPPAATQLILVADTDIDEIDTIEFRVQADGIPTKSARAPRSPSGAPAYLTLFREKGPLGPLEVLALGLRGESPLLARAHTVSFVEGETLVVPLHLARVCSSRVCIGQTCGEHGCLPVELESESLLPWSGAPPELSMLTQCGSVMVDLMSDPNHCGACDDPCTVTPAMQNITAACSAGACTVACQPQFMQCDGDLTNGCESLLTNQNCGRCGKRCNGAQTCVSPGVCMKK